MGGVRVLAAAAFVAAVAAGAPAYADDRVTVEGTALPASAPVSLVHVGCDDLYQPGSGPVVARVGPGPGTAPLGERSLGFELGGGSAVAAAYQVTSVLSATTASVDAWAGSPAAGVGYVVFSNPVGLWVGRADLALPGGSWQTVSALDRAYTWADGTTATVSDFAAVNGGDGAGVFVLGFGCDGTPFRLDALRSGGTTYDLEGISTSLTMASSPDGLTGRLSTGTGEALPHATVVLESRADGSEWEPVAVVPVDDGRVTYAVSPEVDTDYRWRFVDRPLAEGSVSEPVRVPGQPTMSPEPSPGP